jgi:hypothetical protein
MFATTGKRQVRASRLIAAIMKAPVYDDMQNNGDGGNCTLEVEKVCICYNLIHD